MWVADRAEFYINTHAHSIRQSPNLFTGSIAYNIAYCKGKDVRMDDPQLRVRHSPGFDSVVVFCVCFEPMQINLHTDHHHLKTPKRQHTNNAGGGARGGATGQRAGVHRAVPRRVRHRHRRGRRGAKRGPAVRRCGWWLWLVVGGLFFCVFVFGIPSCMIDWLN